MLSLIIILSIIVLIFLFGHYGLGDASQLVPGEKHTLMDDRVAPFELHGDSEIGFLLVHGYAGTPFTMSFLAKQLHDQGHSVFVPLLPGHGTNIDQFHKARYADWLAEVRKSYLKNRSRFKFFFIAGFSMGGNLSLRLISELPRYLHPSGILLFSTPVILNGILNGRFILRDHKLLFSGIIKYIIKTFPKKLESAAAMVISPWIGYNWCHSASSVHSLKLNMPKVKNKISKLTLPICLAHADNDRTVSIENSYFILRRAKSTIKRLLVLHIDDGLTSCHRIITHIHTRDQIFAFVNNFIEEVLSKEYLVTMKSSRGT